MQTFPFVFMGVALALVAGIVIWQIRADRQRTELLRTVAQTMGFSYEETFDADALTQLAGAMPVMNRGHSRKIQRMMRGKLADRDAAIFDYRFTTGGGKSSHTHLQTVVLFPDPVTGLPDFELSPENFLHRVAEAFGYQDLDFPENEEFSKLYLLRGPDEPAIRKLFRSDVLAFLGGAPRWHVQTHGGRLAIFREGKFTQPADMPSYAAEALRIAGLLGRS